MLLKIVCWGMCNPLVPVPIKPGQTGLKCMGQELNLLTGIISSYFEIEGIPVSV